MTDPSVPVELDAVSADTERATAKPPKKAAKTHHFACAMYLHHLPKVLRHKPVISMHPTYLPS